jgi:hypothetical protein
MVEKKHRKIAPLLRARPYGGCTVISLDTLTSLRGSLIVLRRRCGKPNCHCATGQPHTTPALSFSQKGKTRILTLSAAELPAVRRALHHYHLAQASADKQASQGLQLLERHLRARRKA